MNEVARTSHLWSALEEAGAINGVSLTLPPGVSYDQCVGLATMFGGLKRKTSFYIGDLLNYSKREHGEVYAQLSEATGLAPQTRANLESVCDRVPAHVRREGVPFHVHAEVAALPPREQARWLKQVEEQGWSRSQLRDAMHPDRVLPPAVTDDLPSVARAVVDSAKEYGRDYLISRDSFVRLRAALGDTDAE